MNKKHLQETLELFNSGFHCSQSVFAVFSEELELQKETALKIACPFGGGLGGYGRTCGALTGAMMVIGLKYGSADATDIEAKTISKTKTRVLIETFEKENGSSSCNELVGIDRTNIMGADLAALLPHFHTICPKFFKTVVEFLEKEL